METGLWSGSGLYQMSVSNLPDGTYAYALLIHDAKGNLAAGAAFLHIPTYQLQNDYDGDGMLDWWELQHGLNPLSDQDQWSDHDDDELTNREEHDFGTNPHNQDSDFDKMGDGWEIEYGLDPLDPTDASLDLDNDGLENWEEYEAGTNPILADSDADTFPDKWEIENGFDPIDANPSIAQIVVYNIGLILAIAGGVPIALFLTSRYRLRLNAQYAKHQQEEEANAIRRAFRDLVKHPRRAKEEDPG
jgi:hypothetical protein